MRLNKKLKRQTWWKTSGQDAGIGRHIVPPCTDKRRTTNKSKVSRTKEIIEIRAEINKKKSLKNNTEDQWIQELVLWKDKQDWQTFNQTHKEQRTQGLPAKIGKYTVPPRTIKRRKTTNLKTKNNQNWQKIELYGSLTTKELKKKHSSRPVGGEEMGSRVERTHSKAAAGGLG